MPFFQEIDDKYILSNAKYFLIDSRYIVNPKNSIFVAIKGQNHNAHNYIPELISKGIKEFIVEKDSFDESQYADYKDIIFWIVQDSIKTLQFLAQKNKEKYLLQVIGITGSNGKTIVKEWLGTILGLHQSVVKSPRSYNSQIGVPLSVLQIQDFHEVGIFEAGVSKVNEMNNLEKIIQPKIGVFTNIGTAHDEGFQTRKQKIAEKLRLFKKSEILIYQSNNQDLTNEIKLVLRSINPTVNLIDWDFEKNVFVVKNGKRSTIKLIFEEKEFCFKFNFSDSASIQNIVHAIFCCLVLGLNQEQIQEGLNLIKPLEMRMMLKTGIFNSQLIDDSYNNDLAGLETALNFQEQNAGQRDKILIISEILQSGLDEKQLFDTVAGLVESKNISLVVGIGQKFSQNTTSFEGINFMQFDSIEAFLDQKSFFNKSNLSEKSILIKGARNFQFERIVIRLSEKIHQTVLEVDLNALTKNLNHFKRKLQPTTKIMAMVKAFAYGAGGHEVAKLLAFNKIDYLAVAYVDEGISLRKTGIQTPILILNPPIELFETMIEYNLEAEVYCLKTLKYIVDNEQIRINLKVHLKLDTGMHRLGFMDGDIFELLKTLKQIPIQVKSIFSHLASAGDSKFNDFTNQQIDNFRNNSSKIIEVLGYKPMLHIANSAGSLKSDAEFDMIRLGIGLYGTEKRDSNGQELENVLTLKTIISQIKNLNSTETVGYSRSGGLERDSKIATIAIGYADGYDRRLGGGVGKVLVNGQLCKTVGNICMDMCMVDVTDVDCEEGDEVILFGNDLPIAEVANAMQTISYEVVAKINERIKRVFFKD